MPWCKHPLIVLPLVLLVVGVHQATSQDNETALCPNTCHCVKESAKCAQGEIRVILSELRPEYVTLSFHDMIIPSIRNNSFVQHNRVQQLSLSYNRITNVESEGFQGLSNLLELDLGGNRISRLPARTFQYNQKLQRLALKNNPLSIDEVFLDISSLEYFTLANCHLKKIPKDFFHKVPNLKTLDLSSNSLQTLSMDTVEVLDHLKSIHLSKNAWVCDCNQTDLHVWYTETLHMDGERVHCEAPASVNGSSWSQTLKNPCVEAVSLNTNKTSFSQPTTSSNSFGWGFFVGVLSGSILLAVLFTMFYFFSKNSDKVVQVIPCIRYQLASRQQRNDVNGLSLKHPQELLAAEEREVREFSDDINSNNPQFAQSGNGDKGRNYAQ